MNSKIIFCFLLILVVSLVSTGCAKNTGPGKYDSFAKCLSEKGAKMYGTDWCSHCKAQKKLFGNSFQYVNYVDCDWNKDECLKAGIQGYPTWIIDNKMYTSEQSLERLASLTGCGLAEDKTE